MKRIELTQDKYTLVDDEDFEYLNQWKWQVKKTEHNYYAGRSYRKPKRASIFMHRLIMNCPNNKFIDHKDGNGLNNQKENLRICNATQNVGNSKIPKHNTSGIKGVCWDRANKKWIASITINNKINFLGRFTNKLDAKNAYTTAAKKHFGEFYSDGIRN